MSAPIKVIYIAGSGRSGSTLLSRLLGSLDGIFNIGEGGRTWTRSDMRRTSLHCSCGCLVENCPFWRGWGDALPALEQAIGHKLRTRAALFSKFGGDQQYADVLAENYRRIANRSMAECIVDSSKDPALAMLLALSKGIEPLFVHLVRDPRSVILSWSRKKAYLEPMPAWEAALRWVLNNLVCERLRLTVPERTVFLRYEDFLRDPSGTVRYILERAGLDQRPVDHLAGRVKVGLQHALAGNPDKLTDGVVEVRQPTIPMARGPQLAELVTWPLAARYGYAELRRVQSAP